MNREQKRAAQKAGQVDADGQQTTVRDRRAPAKSLKTERTKPLEFVREVRAELKKVAWPTRDEVKRYSLIVFVALVIFTAFVFGVDYLFEWFFRVVTDPDASALGAVITAPPI